VGKVIAFQLNGKEYAVPVHQVLAIEKLHHITRVPRTPAFVQGVMNLRGVVIPVIDLKKRFQIETETQNDHEKMMIVTVNDLEVGLVVDAATDVLDIASENIEPQPEIVDTVKSEFIDGVAHLDQRLLMLLNLEKILTPLS